MRTVRALRSAYEGRRWYSPTHARYRSFLTWNTVAVGEEQPDLAGAGWYDDPLVVGGLRWWDGRSWTQFAAPSRRRRRPLFVAAIITGAIAGCFGFTAFLSVYGDPAPEDHGEKPLPSWAGEVYLGVAAFTGLTLLLVLIDRSRESRRYRHAVDARSPRMVAMGGAVNQTADRGSNPSANDGR